MVLLTTRTSPTTIKSLVFNLTGTHPNKKMQELRKRLDGRKCKKSNSTNFFSFQELRTKSFLKSDKLCFGRNVTCPDVAEISPQPSFHHPKLLLSREELQHTKKSIAALPVSPLSLSLALALGLSLSHTHIHTLTFWLSFCCTQTHSMSLFVAHIK